MPGGKILGEPMPIPGRGEYVAYIDTEESLWYSSAVN